LVSEKKNTHILIAILFLALILRIGFVLNLPLEFIQKWESDAGVYRGIAVNLINTHKYGREEGIADAQDPPLYPFFLALVYRFFGAEKTSIIVIRLLQSFLGVLTCLLVYLIATRMFNQRIGILSSLVVTVHPAIIAYTGLHLTETLFIFLLSLFVLYFIKSYFVHSISTKDTFLCGVFWSLTVLSREELLLFPLFIILGLFWIGKEFKGVAKYAIVFLAGALIILGSWITRNYIIFHKFVPVTKGGGEILYVSNYLDPGEKWTPDGERFHRILQDAKTNIRSSYIKETIKNLRDMLRYRPFEYLNMLWEKLKELWLHPSGLYQIPIKSLKIVYLLIHYLLLCLCGIGIINSFALKNRKIIPLILLLVYVTIFHVLILFPLARYMLPFLPYVFILSAQGFLRLLNVFREYKRFLGEV